MDPQERIAYWTEKKVRLERQAGVCESLASVFNAITTVLFVLSLAALGAAAFRYQGRPAAIGAFVLVLSFVTHAARCRLARVADAWRAEAVNCVWHTGAAKIAVLKSEPEPDPVAAADQTPPKDAA